MDNEPNFSNEEMRLPTEKFRGLKNNADGRPILILVLFVALLVILFGLYQWQKSLQVVPAPVEIPIRPTTETNREPETTTATAQVESFGALSTSDELDAIESDLESTNLDSLETELNQIDSDLNAGVQ
jgi:hypothetical protein